MPLRRFSLGILCSTVFLLSACGPGYEWSHASSLNTVPAYQQFLSKYPNDPHAAAAHRRIAQLEDQKAWTRAQIASTIQGYEQYLRGEPSGSHAQAARDEILTRERAAAWQTVQANETPQSLQAFLDKYPSGPEADQARSRLTEIAGYRAEFGTARSQRLAERERDLLAKRFGKELRQVVVLKPDGKDRDFRITSVPMSEEAAGEACAPLQLEGRSCTVVQVTG